jgi:hypothetical protein
LLKYELSRARCGFRPSGSGQIRRVRQDARPHCTNTSTGLTALPDLGANSYQEAVGGLYLGTNEAPLIYADDGSSSAAAIVPRDVRGRPRPAGKIVLLSIGMSNASQEFAVFAQSSLSDPERYPHVAVVDGAQSGMDAHDWTDPDAIAWDVVRDRLRARSLGRGQVQAIWLKQAIQNPSGDFLAYRAELAAALRTIIGNAKAEYPNLQQVFISSRTYGGYASGQGLSSNPEPYAYWTGFADRDVISDSLAIPSDRPWLGWAPYLWTDGLVGRSDGLVWTCDDVNPLDGIHPSLQARQKVATMLQNFFDNSRFTAWYGQGEHVEGVMGATDVRELDARAPFAGGRLRGPVPV